MSTNRPKPTVGQQLFTLDVSQRYHSQRHKPRDFLPVVVTKVGRKYFTTETTGQYPRAHEFHIEGWQEKGDFCCRSVKLYVSEQERADEVETDSALQVLWKAFEHGNNHKKLPLRVLRTIRQLVEAHQEPQ